MNKFISSVVLIAWGFIAFNVCFILVHITPLVMTFAQALMLIVIYGFIISVSVLVTKLIFTHWLETIRK